VSISGLAHFYQRVVFSIVLALMIYGLMSFFQLPSREDPKITIREAVITTVHPGMPSEQVEQLITKTLEEAIIEMPEIEEIRSYSQPGVSIIHAEALDIYFNLDQMWDDLRHKISRVQNQLPEGTFPPQVNDTFGDVAVITAALHGKDYHYGEMLDMAEHVRTQMYGVRGVKKIDLLGVQQERIFLEYEDAKLASFGITPQQLSGILRSQNIIFAGGLLETGEKAFLLDPSGLFDSIEDVGETLIPLPNNQGIVPLRDLVNIRYGVEDPPQQKAYFNGHPSIVFAIAMNDQFNLLDFSPRMIAKMEEISQTLPAGLNLEVITRQAEQVENAVFGVTRSVIQTLVIVLVVVVLFLGLRTGLIVGAIVPAVMLITLSVMSFTGIPLERMSLATLIISLGLLVDNGIVIAEDFLRGLEDGESREETMKRTGRELAIPLLTSSLTTVLVFMPLMLADHVSGEYTRSISIIILYTLSISWLLALTVTPLLCYHFIKVDKVKDGESKNKPDITHRLFDAMNSGYRFALKLTLRFRPLFILLMVALLGLAIVGLNNTKKEFFPGSDRTQLLMYLDFPPDTPSTEVDRRMQDVFTFLNDRETLPHVNNYAGYVGFGGPRFVLSLTPIDPIPYKGFVMVNVDQYDNIGVTQKQLIDQMSARFPDIETGVNRMFLGPTDSSVIEIQVKGPDADFLYETALKIQDILHSVPDTVNIGMDWEGRVTRLAIEINQLQARRAGVSSADVARSLRTYFSGENVSDFVDGDQIFPIVLRGSEAERHNLERTKSVTIFPANGGPGVPLESIAEVKLVNGFARIAHENLVRTISVDGKNYAMSAEVLKPIIDEQIQELAAQMPPNHSIEYDGVIAMSIEAQAALTAYLPICLGMIFWVLMFQFNSFRRTGIILITLPLLIIGAALGLFIFGASMGFMVTLGLYSLAGILANNAIVLIDRIDLERLQEPDKEPWQVIVDASVRRLRPIVMSTGTTVLGLLPLILSKDVLFYGMSLAIAGGLIVGTLLTLGLVPVLYSYFFKIKKPKAAEVKS
jgi:multidrug efflux pump subunit AcrB